MICKEQLLKDWNELHLIPEIAFNEYKTSAYIKERLLQNGFLVKNLLQTGILAEYDTGISGPSYCLRADIDALSFPNFDGGFEIKHACAHDAHAAMVLSAGCALKKEGLKKGKLYLLFQPAEETVKGANEILKAGLPKLDGMFGIHLRPEVELPFGKATAQLMHNASIPTKAIFYGKAAHGARPHLGINALSAAALAITKIDALKLDTDENWSAKATIADCFGNLQNVIPDRVEIDFDLRAKTNEIGKKLSVLVEQCCNEAAQKIGCTVEFSNHIAYAAEYSKELVNIYEKAIISVLGEVEKPINTVGSEDFHAYHIIGKIPTAYMGLGSDLKPGLHSRDMCFSTECLPYGAEILYRTIKIAFGENF